ncbi:hypothetical protein ALC62_11571 [Cyphomyrmex costatus]|uniref:Uncharacterized protein n=1 Tax=Cyphomyrmex costatus TaxID=456900 RepID=A0A151ICC5_9HYME|nr:hypothetical protein ALC62_11571 [Cyphomyrmex costatus]
MIRQAVHHDETLAVLDVQVAHRRELLGTGGVEDLEDARRVVHLDLLAVEILDRRVVLLHEAAGHELDVSLSRICQRQRYPRPCLAEEQPRRRFHKCLKNYNLRELKNSLNNYSRSNNSTEVISDIEDPICEPQMQACDTL